MFVAVGVLVLVAVGVFVTVAVLVGVLVRVAVGVFVAAGVFVGVGASAHVWPRLFTVPSTRLCTSCGVEKSSLIVYEPVLVSPLSGAP